MKRPGWLSGPHGVRPAGPDDKCFYCGAQALAEQHKPGCVIRRRTVVLRATIEYVVDVPEGWTEEEIRFHYNEGRWCMNNLVDDLAKHVDLEGDGPCLCQSQVSWRQEEQGWISGQAANSPFQSEVEYVREADEIDESWSRIKAAELPS